MALSKEKLVMELAAIKEEHDELAARYEEYVQVARNIQNKCMQLQGQADILAKLVAEVDEEGSSELAKADTSKIATKVDSDPA